MKNVKMTEAEKIKKLREINCSLVDSYSGMGIKPFIVSEENAEILAKNVENGVLITKEDFQLFKELYIRYDERYQAYKALHDEIVKIKLSVKNEIIGLCLVPTPFGDFTRMTELRNVYISETDNSYLVWSRGTRKGVAIGSSFPHVLRSATCETLDEREFRLNDFVKKERTEIQNFCGPIINKNLTAEKYKENLKELNKERLRELYVDFYLKCKTFLEKEDILYISGTKEEIEILKKKVLSSIPLEERAFYKNKIFYDNCKE
ncbi:MAG: hypothetical protein IKU15_05515 [Clostridia bacterium]|nr:hypothetical protein [Treponema sp.]MBR4890727.1 hypothetical protein [Clostridia bacterium]